MQDGVPMCPSPRLRGSTLQDRLGDAKRFLFSETRQEHVQLTVSQLPPNARGNYVRLCVTELLGVALPLPVVTSLEHPMDKSVSEAEGIWSAMVKHGRS